MSVGWEPFTRPGIRPAADVTGRKEAEAALRLRDRAIRAVARGIVITDPTLRAHRPCYRAVRRPGGASRVPPDSNAATASIFSSSNSYRVASMIARR